MPTMEEDMPAESDDTPSTLLPESDVDDGLPLEEGEPLTNIVGKNVMLVAGGKSHSGARICAALEAIGISVQNAPSGLSADFAGADARGYKAVTPSSTPEFSPRKPEVGMSA